MVVTDIQFCFAMGACFADLGAAGITKATTAADFPQSDLYARYRSRALSYPCLFLGPAATMFMLAWPGWETQYVAAAFQHTAGAPFNAALYGAFLLLLGLGAWFGTWLGFRWVLAGGRGRLRAVYLAVLAATIALVAVRGQAFVHLGTYEEFARDPSAMPYIWQDGTFFTSFWILSAYSAAPLLVWLIQIRKQQPGAAPDARGSLA